jgi:hypothetical protein
MARYDRPDFPVGATIAGIIWIVVGSLGLIGATINLVTGAADFGPPNQQPPPPGAAEGRMCGMVLGVLIYLAFLLVGIQTVKGNARGLIGNSVGSVLVSLILLGVGALGFLVGAAVPGGQNANRGILLVMSLLLLGLGGGLMLAGILGFVNNTAYQEWRASEGLDGRRRRRRDDDYDDDYDDRPRRRRDDDDYDDDGDRRDRRPRRRDDD